jgi:hypothetical protein
VTPCNVVEVSEESVAIILRPKSASETVNIYQTVQRHMPGDSKVHSHRRRYLRSRVMTMVPLPIAMEAMQWLGAMLVVTLEHSISVVFSKGTYCELGTVVSSQRIEYYIVSRGIELY